MRLVWQLLLCGAMLLVCAAEHHPKHDQPKIDPLEGLKITRQIMKDEKLVGKHTHVVWITRQQLAEDRGCACKKKNPDCECAGENGEGSEHGESGSGQSGSGSGSSSRSESSKSGSSSSKSSSSKSGSSSGSSSSGSSSKSESSKSESSKSESSKSESSKSESSKSESSKSESSKSQSSQSRKGHDPREDFLVTMNLEAHAQLQSTDGNLQSFPKAWKQLIKDLQEAHHRTDRPPVLNVVSGNRHHATSVACFLSSWLERHGFARYTIQIGSAGGATQNMSAQIFFPQHALFSEFRRESVLSAGVNNDDRKARKHCSRVVLRDEWLDFSG